jgi:CheY-like chemotaxis protein
MRPDEKATSTPANNEASGTAEALHDVSNALTVVLGWLEEASREGADAEHRAHALDVASRKAREARTLARRAIRGTEDADDAAAPAGALVADVADALAVELERRRVALDLRGVETAALVPRGTALGHVLTNLMLNALAFAPPRSTIHVAVAAALKEVTITIADEGPGVDPKILPRLFEGSTARVGGTGIGLRHSREVARALGGDVWHEPSKVGALFKVRIPRAPDDAPAPVPIDRPSTTLTRAVAGARVLVVEDDRAVCALLDAGLGARGVEVVALHDAVGLDAKLAKLGAFDAVLLDLSPIAQDVPGALALVRRALPDAGIVFISGSAIASDVELGSAAGNTRWVRKPFELGEIAQALAELLPNGPKR